MRTILGYNDQGDLFHEFKYELPAPYNPTAWRTEYQRYLRTNTWAAKREITKELAGYYCEAALPGCEGDANLQVHHLNYKRAFGQERCGIDIRCLCGHCHREIHAKPIIERDPPANDNRPDANDNVPRVPYKRREAVG